MSIGAAVLQPWVDPTDWMLHASPAPLRIPPPHRPALSKAHEHDWQAGLERAVVESGGNVRLMPLAEEAVEGLGLSDGLFDCLPLDVSDGAGALQVQVLGGVDEPAAKRALAAGQECAVIVMTPLTRMIATHTITGQVAFQLNERRRVEALQLRRVGAITSAQRRNAYRVRTLGLAFDHLRLRGPGGAELGGVLGNLSATGAGLKVDLYELAEARLSGEGLHLELRPSEEAVTLDLPCRLVRVGDPLGRTLDLGVVFEPERTDDPKGLMEALACLRNRLERAQLRRRRSA